MDETPLTNEELTAAIRKLQSDVLSLTERVEYQERETPHQHLTTEGRTGSQVYGGLTNERPARLERKAPLPSRLTT